MPTPETIAVAVIVLAAAVYLVWMTVLKYRKRQTEEGPCSGCGCGRATQLTRRSGLGHRGP
ncbi:MAG: hypothetical protein NTV93_02610 [Verrucomicrobia bacterium]|nr:hypothetical protein [Verrucomicrobiota bacterium]